MTTIGAVILSYNKAYIWERFWNSLVGQTRPPDQVVIVDDGSDGGTGFLEEAARVGARIIKTPRLRQSAARNTGLSHIKTDLVIFLDGDLLLQSNMLGRMEVELDSHPDVSFVYCPYDRTGSQAGRIDAHEWNTELLKRGNYISPMSLTRRPHLPDPCFDVEFDRYEDWDLWIRMAKSGRKGKLINEILFCAYYRPGDLSARGDDRDWFFRLKAKHNFQA